MASLGMLPLLATLFVTLFFAGKVESHVPSPYQNEKESIMPKLGMDTERTWDGYGKNTDFTLEVPDVTQHENIAGKVESHVPSPYQNEKESMIPKLGMDTERTWHGYGKNTNFTLKDEVPDVTQHENIADIEVSKYHVHRKELRRLVNHGVFRTQMSSNEVPSDEYKRAMPVGPDPVDDPEPHP